MRHQGVVPFAARWPGKPAARTLRRAGLPAGSPVSSAQIGQSCAAWSGMTTSDKLRKISDWGTRYGYTLTTDDVVSISATFDTFCSELPHPTLTSIVGSENCDLWNLLSAADKTTRVSQWMEQYMFTTYGYSYFLPGTSTRASLV